MKSRITAIYCLSFIVSSLLFGSDISNHKKKDLNTLHGYIDSIVQAEMASIHVPGAILVIVQDSHEVYQKGYGYADVENQLPVDIGETGFRIASVTKTFTATAIMQLVDKGLIDLHLPISNYLPDEDFEFLKYKPFTVHQLLTHTAGIDLIDIGDASPNPEGVIPLETFVRSHIPKQVHNPGEVYSYSNFGYTILGYLIQEISGMPYEEYIHKNILTPLQMTHSDMSQPLPEPLRSNLANGYKWDGEYVNLPRDYTNTVPGGGLISTGSDMSKYLIMHLNGGTLDSTQILNSESYNELTKQHYGSLETKYGICYAFNENGWTGRRSLDHTGGQLGFLSLLLMIPETGTGIFVAHNSREDASAFRYNVTQTILDTLLHRNERHIDLPGPSDQLDKLAHNYIGRYQQMNYPHSTYEKLGLLFGFYNSAYVVRSKKNGFLHLNRDDFVMLNERLFHINDESSPWNVEFELDENGKAQKINAGLTSYKRTPWYQSKKVWQRLLAFSLLIALINLMKYPVRRIWHKFKTGSHYSKTSNPIVKWLNWTSAFLIVGFIGLMIHLLLYGGALADYGVPLSFKMSLVLNTVGGFLTFFFPFPLYKLFKSNLEMKVKIWNGFVILSLIIITIGFWNFNIIGFQF